MSRAIQQRISLEPVHDSAAAPRSNRRERHRLETRERLYRAALNLFGERGFMETTVEDITNAADVGKGTFFNYFPTKEHVLAAYGGERIAAVERALEKARSSEGSVLEVLGELATDSAGQSHENPAILRAIYAAHASCAPVRAELQKRMETSRKILAEIISLAQKRGEMRRDMPSIEMARLVQTVVIGMTMAWALNPDRQFQKTAKQVWDLICPTLRANGAARYRAQRKSSKG
ncbi:MAG: TetR/AcrR family transcriptional regulator [Candidatus Acidiferrales bacterium]